MARDATGREVWHAYYDSVAEGVRREAVGPEPVYDDDDLAHALEWASTVKWGAFMLVWAKGEDPDTKLREFVARALALGYRPCWIHKGQGDATWRMRIEALSTKPTQLSLV